MAKATGDADDFDNEAESMDDAGEFVADDDLDEVDLEGDLEGDLDEADLDEVDLDEALGDELEEDDLGDGDLDGDELGGDLDEEADDEGSTIARRPGTTSDDDEEDDDDELDPDDVEASLDDILKDRLVIEEVEPDDDEDTPEPEDRSEGASVVVPKRPDEFVCQSCFLVKHPSQLADAGRMLCRDCV